MKILFVMIKMDLGGTEKALLSLLAALEKYPLQITLLLLEKGGLLTNQIPTAIKVEYLEGFESMKPIINDPPLKTILNNVKRLRLSEALRFLIIYMKMKTTGNWFHKYEAAIKTAPYFGSYDIAVAFAGPSDFITYFVHEKVTAKKKVQWIHFDIEKVIANFNFGKKYYPFFDKIFCVSQSARDIFLKHFPQMTNKTEVFHNIVSEAEIKKQAASGGTFTDNFEGVRILSVGRFTQEKGQHLIPEVAARLKADSINFRWYLVGGGREKTNVQKMALDLGLADELIFVGEKENPYRYMQDCDIYVQPSLHEGFGITVAEAKVFNKPIVVTNFASAKDLIRHNETGLITEISEESLYLNLKNLILQPELQTLFTNNLNKDVSKNTHADILSKLMS